MRHFTHFTKAHSSSANFKNIYQTGLQNLISPVVEKETKKYIRKKKEQAGIEKES